MKHPILSGNGYKLYFIIWIVVIAVHASVLYFYYDFSILVSIIDSLVTNVFFSGIVPGLWFVVVYAGSNKDELSIIGAHIVAASISILLWIFVTSSILDKIYFANSEYQTFLQSSLIWRIIIGSFFYSISVLIFYLIKYYQDMQKRLNRELELQNLLQDSELRMLKSQINPHFIFNSLNSVSALTLSAPKSARDMVIKLSEFLRYSLGKENTELVTLKQEVENVSLYLDIEKVRFGDRLSFKKKVETNCEEMEVPNLILQPLIENAIKHGVYGSTEEVEIKLSCTKGDDHLLITIENNFDPATVSQKGSGIGLSNVRKRLSLVYEEGDLLQTQKSQNSFIATMKIPLETDGKD